MSSGSDEGRELVLAVRAIKPDALRRLCDYGYTVLRRAAVLRAGDEADDLLQETMLNAVTYLHRYNASLPFKPWLFAILINCARDFFKGRFAQLEFVDGSELQSRESADSRAAITEIFAALRSLTPRQSDAMGLHLSGLETREIASIMHIREETVRSHISGARKCLERIVQAEPRKTRATANARKRPRTRQRYEGGVTP